ncbi:MAG: hypothetical protein H6R40_1343 [Gemmatimonadetes bacterium]|nr:hypothetical protein [Gemmatimonadota bacterium]
MGRSSLVHRGGPVLLRTLLAAGAILVGPARVARAQNTVGEVWPELDAYVRLSSAVRLFFMAAPVFSRDAKSLSEQQLGANVEMGVAPLAPARRARAQDADKLSYLRFRLGYYRIGTHDSSGSSLSERRLIAEVTPRVFLPLDLLVALRGRMDFRWLEEGYSWRPRVRLWIEREGPVGPVVLIPYVSAETFYDSRYDAWSRSYYQTGIAVPVSRRVVPEVYYGRQLDREPSDKTVNALGMVVTLYF